MTDPRPIREAELHALVDGELSEAERAELGGLLTAAPAELAAAREIADLNDALKERYAGRLAEPVPAAMLKVLARMASRESIGTRTSSRRRAAVAAGVLVALIAGAAGFVARDLLPETRQPEAALAATALSAHVVYVPEVRHPVEVGAAEEAHLVRWLAKRIGADVRAPALASLGWKLVGGRLLPDRGLPAAQFMYEDAAGRRLTLYVRRETGLANTSFRFAERDGFGAFYWIDRPLAYALAGRLARAELMQLATAVYADLEAAGAARAADQTGRTR